MTWSIDNRVNQNSLDLDIETKLSLAGRWDFGYISIWNSNWSLISLLWSISIPFSSSIPKVKARLWCIFSLCKFPSLIQFIAVPPRRRGGRSRSRSLRFIIEWILRLARKKCNKEVKILELSTFYFWIANNSTCRLTNRVWVTRTGTTSSAGIEIFSARLRDCT